MSGDSLAAFDRKALGDIGDELDRHVKRVRDRVEAEESLTAAVVSDYITEEDEEEFEDFLLAIWILLLSQYPDWATDEEVEAAIRSALIKYRSTLTELVVRTARNPSTREPIFGEYSVDQIAQLGAAREILVELGGGSPNGETQMGGLATGLLAYNWLSQRGILTDEKVWLYGAQDRRTFDGHLALNNLVFTDWFDDRLQVRPQDAWLRTTHYGPGDHWGCGCIVGPNVPELNLSNEL